LVRVLIERIEKGAALETARPFEFAINLKTAKALGLTVLPALMR